MKSKLINFRIDSELKRKIDLMLKWKKSDQSVSELLRGFIEDSINREVEKITRRFPNIIVIASKFDHNQELSLEELIYLFTQAHQSYLHNPNESLNSAYLIDCISAFEAVILLLSDVPDPEVYSINLRRIFNNDKPLTLLEKIKLTKDYILDPPIEINRGFAEIITRPLEEITKKKYFKNIDVISLNNDIKFFIKSLIILSKFNLSINKEIYDKNHDNHPQLAHFADLDQLYRKIIPEKDITKDGIKCNEYKGKHFNIKVNFGFPLNCLFTIIYDGKETVPIELNLTDFISLNKALSTNQKSGRFILFPLENSYYILRYNNLKFKLSKEKIHEIKEIMTNIFTERQSYFSEIAYQYGDI